MAKTEAITAAAPDISAFIASIPAAGFKASPPVSNVMPLPTNANLFLAFAGLYETCKSLGGFAEP